MKLILLLALFMTAITGAEPAVEINKKYIGGNYTFSGTVEHKNELINSIYRFTGKTTADTFECEWVDHEGDKGSVKVTTNSGSLTIPGILVEQNFTDPLLAISSATAVSGGSAHLMYALWKGQKEDVFPSTNIVQSKTKDGFLISGSSHIEGNTLSVTTTKDNIITAIKCVTDPSKITIPELSDQDIKAALKSLGQPDTPEAIESFRKAMTIGKDALATSKDEMIVTTMISVKWKK